MPSYRSKGDLNNNSKKTCCLMLLFKGGCFFENQAILMKKINYYFQKTEYNILSPIAIQRK